MVSRLALAPRLSWELSCAFPSPLRSLSATAPAQVLSSACCCLFLLCAGNFFRKWCPSAQLQYLHTSPTSGSGGGCIRGPLHPAQEKPDSEAALAHGSSGWGSALKHFAHFGLQNNLCLGHAGKGGQGCVLSSWRHQIAS